tara:strand:- start:3384 stop:3842 length:459 start_codon:yes stop_codon:yes gene_type:complete
MQRTETVTVQADIEHAFSVLSDLAIYTQWLNFIDSVEPVGTEDDLVWMLVLKARLGPFSRMKKLRMAKVTSEPHKLIRFERKEISGKDAADWSIDVNLKGLGAMSTEIIFVVSYSGKFWNRTLETVFNTYVDQARTDLKAYFVSLRPQSEDE